jgi:hypothetical protein
MSATKSSVRSITKANRRLRARSAPPRRRGGAMATGAETEPASTAAPRSSSTRRSRPADPEHELPQEERAPWRACRVQGSAMDARPRTTPSRKTNLPRAPIHWKTRARMMATATTMNTNGPQTGWPRKASNSVPRPWCHWYRCWKPEWPQPPESHSERGAVRTSQVRDGTATAAGLVQAPGAQRSHRRRSSSDLRAERRVCGPRQPRPRNGACEFPRLRTPPRKPRPRCLGRFAGRSGPGPTLAWRRMPIVLAFGR